MQLLAVGAVSPRKGYAVLVEALRDLTDLDWHLTIAGSLDHAPDAAAALGDAIQAACLNRRITVAGAVDDSDLARLYDRADLFVSPSLFEGYGMVLAEAMARGLPLVASTGGAAAETVPDAAGVKVPPGDVAALARGAAAPDHATGLPAQPSPRAPGPPARPCRAGATRPRASPACSKAAAS